MDQAYPLLRLTGGISVIQMDKAYPPAGLQSLTGGISFILMDGLRLAACRTALLAYLAD